jgi:hypothetical protein
MNPYEIEKAVSDFLTANWTYTSIRKINIDDAPALPFIECYCKPGAVSNLEIQGHGARTGVFMINVFTTKGAGVQQGGSYAGKLEELFWHRTILDIVCENALLPYTEFYGIDEALQACHHQVIIPFNIIMEY